MDGDLWDIWVDNDLLPFWIKGLLLGCDLGLALPIFLFSHLLECKVLGVDL